MAIEEVNIPTLVQEKKSSPKRSLLGSVGALASAAAPVAAYFNPAVGLALGAAGGVANLAEGSRTGAFGVNPAGGFSGALQTSNAVQRRKMNQLEMERLKKEQAEDPLDISLDAIDQLHLDPNSADMMRSKLLQAKQRKMELGGYM